MNDLYNELVSSNTQYLENGEMRSNPPTSLQLRAARCIKQAFEENQGLGRAHIQLQQEVARLHEQLQLFRNNLTQLQQEILILKASSDSNGNASEQPSPNVSICDTGQEASKGGD